jgi:hypothetical protein
MVVGTIRGTPQSLWYNRFDAAARQWDVSARIPRESFSPLTFGVVKPVSDNAGNALLLFEYSTSNIDMTLAVKEYDSGLGWDRNNVLLASQVKVVFVPGPAGTIPAGGHVDIAMSEIGDAVAVWVTSLSGVETLWAKRFIAGVGWEPAPVQLSFTTEVNGTIRFPKVAINARGDAAVVWGEFSGSTSSLFSVRAIRYAAGAGWEGSISTLDTQTINPVPLVTVDRDGNGLSVWRRDTGEVMANRYASGQAWEGPIRINGTDVTSSPSLMDIGVDGAGRVVALWGDSSAGLPRLRARRYSPTGGWGTIVTVAGAVGGTFDYSMNDSGQGVVASRAGSPLVAYAVRYDGDSDTWGNVMTVDDSPATGALGAFTYVDPSGTPYVTWGWANNDPPNTFASRIE